MSIGRDPREWIIEILGAGLAVWGMIRSALLGDLVFFSVSFGLGIAVLQLYRLRRKFSISVRDRH